MTRPHRARARYAPGVMNDSESRYAREHLEHLRLAGKIRKWSYEPVKLRIGHRCFYSPDFMVITADGLIEFHEFKGHWEDDARVKIKAAASIYPEFAFVAITRERGALVFEVIRAHCSEVEAG